jgi:CrcB protein
MTGGCVHPAIPEKVQLIRLRGECAFMVHKLVLLVLAGGAGTLARYGTAGFVQKIYGTSFPWGTLAVNLAGCFLAGLLWVLFENRWPVSGETRTIVLVGFMGAFTTFSAFILETGELARSAEWIRVFANLAAQNVFGLLALFVGMALARTI